MSPPAPSYFPIIPILATVLYLNLSCVALFASFLVLSRTRQRHAFIDRCSSRDRHTDRQTDCRSSSTATEIPCPPIMPGKWENWGKWTPYRAWPGIGQREATRTEMWAPPGVTVYTGQEEGPAGSYEAMWGWGPTS